MALTFTRDPPQNGEPMRISTRGWWTLWKWRDLTPREAEAYHLRCAAECVLVGHRFGVDEHLKSARANYIWSSQI
jgi:hypothetical protein